MLNKQKLKMVNDQIQNFLFQVVPSFVNASCHYTHFHKLHIYVTPHPYNKSKMTKISQNRIDDPYHH